MKDGEIAIIRPGDLSLDRSRVIKTKSDEEILLTPDPYPHWTIKEIHDQPVAVLRALGFGSRLNSDLSKIFIFYCLFLCKILLFPSSSSSVSEDLVERSTLEILGYWEGKSE